MVPSRSTVGKISRTSITTCRRSLTAAGSPATSRMKRSVGWRRNIWSEIENTLQDVRGWAPSGNIVPNIVHRLSVYWPSGLLAYLYLGLMVYFSLGLFVYRLPVALSIAHPYITCALPVSVVSFELGKPKYSRR